MKLPYEFCRLPLQVDVARLRQEVAALPADAWHRHPSGYTGNSSVRLISVDGGENDEVAGEMRATPHLQACPYIRQVLAALGVVWSRSRLMRLGPRSEVPEHCDINHHWFFRVRLHIPVVTFPAVRFHCGESNVHMREGEAWVFDNWRPHRVENPTASARIHLVADTSGSADFWRLVSAGQTEGFDGPPASSVQTVRFDSQLDASPLMERFNAPAVLHPGELEGLVRDLAADLVIDGDPDAVRLARYRMVLDGLCRDWRQLWALFADSPPGWRHFTGLRDAVRTQARALGSSIHARSNGVAATRVLEARVLAHAINTPAASIAPDPEYAERPSRSVRTGAPLLQRPLFIVAAPRSGSTLLYETLSCTPQLWNLGGEAHWLVETIPELKPGAAGVDSNRLTAAHLNEAVARNLRDKIADELVHPLGRRWTDGETVRLLEKTPKNALRIPFFDRLFGDAQFVFLWRDPRENIASLIEAWRSGNWVTYPDLPGWEGPWSLLLPPGWEELRGRPLEDVAAFQWARSNRIILEDLEQLPRSRWMALSYESLTSSPVGSIEKICNFAGIAVDAELATRVRRPLPLSRHTLTAPRQDKWRSHQQQIERVLPGVESVWQRLRMLGDQGESSPAGSAPRAS